MKVEHAMRKKLVIGNWKMNGSRPGNAGLLAALLAARPFTADVAVCVPAVYLSETATTLAQAARRWPFPRQRDPLGRAGRVCARTRCLHRRGLGGDAGRVRLPLRDRWSFHSERRAIHGETDQTRGRQGQGRAGQGQLTPIVCVGETLARARGRPNRQRRQAPAFGSHPHTGALHRPRSSWPTSRCGPLAPASRPRPEQAQAVHALLRAQLHAATETVGRDPASSTAAASRRTTPALLFAQADIDGGLIGGASLKAADFTAICQRLNASLTRTRLPGVPSHAHLFLNLIVARADPDGAGDDRPGADPARQGRRHGRLVRQRLPRAACSAPLAAPTSCRARRPPAPLCSSCCARWHWPPFSTQCANTAASKRARCTAARRARPPAPAAYRRRRGSDPGSVRALPAAPAAFGRAACK